MLILISVTLSVVWFSDLTDTFTVRMLTSILCLGFLIECKSFSQALDYQLLAFGVCFFFFRCFWIISYSLETWPDLWKFSSEVAFTYILDYLIWRLESARAIPSSQFRFFPSTLCRSNILTEVISHRRGIMRWKPSREVGAIDWMGWKLLLLNFWLTG